LTGVNFIYNLCNDHIGRWLLGRSVGLYYYFFNLGTWGEQVAFTIAVLRIFDIQSIGGMDEMCQYLEPINRRDVPEH